MPLLDAYDIFTTTDTQEQENITNFLRTESTIVQDAILLSIDQQQNSTLVVDGQLSMRDFPEQLAAL